MKKITLILILTMVACKREQSLAPIPENAVKPTIVTEQTPNDTDDPAIWYNQHHPEQSLIIGTDKQGKSGGLYAYNLSGKIVNKVENLDRPNNVDIAYDFSFNGKNIPIAVVTERNQHQIRVFTLPDLKPIDGGGIKVFEDSSQNEPMGIALYHSPKTQKIYAIVGRKEGPSSEYLYQYELNDEGGKVNAKLIRKFGKYSGNKEIEAIAVDNELGYIYYCDETAGIRKYYAEPNQGNQELSFFGTKDFKHDHEGIAIYKTNEKKGYILVSDQQRNFFNVYKREGHEDDPNQHDLIAQIPVSTIECDGADALNAPMSENFPSGIFVAMSNGKTFHIYDWREIQKRILSWK